MDSIISLTGKDFGIIAINTSYVNSIIVARPDLNKFVEIGKNKILTVTGYPGDVVQFADFIHKTVHFHTLKRGFVPTTHSIANYIRTEIAECLRKCPFFVNLILLGFDGSVGPFLYSIDYMGTLQRMDYCVQGYAAFIIFSYLNQQFQSKMNLIECLRIIRQSISLLKYRFMINQGNFLIKLINVRGSVILV